MGCSVFTSEGHSLITFSRLHITLEYLWCVDWPDIHPIPIPERKYRTRSTKANATSDTSTESL